MGIRFLCSCGICTWSPNNIKRCFRSWENSFVYWIVPNLCTSLLSTRGSCQSTRRTTSLKDRFIWPMNYYSSDMKTPSHICWLFRVGLNNHRGLPRPLVGPKKVIDVKRFSISKGRNTESTKYSHSMTGRRGIDSWIQILWFKLTSSEMRTANIFISMVKWEETSKCSIES